ncbi:LuxR C-terminal-related transcriptional regulator [Nonomuraea sp. NPDC050643]|uniref:helix-turn-helix transcriptional regulator n=1 Tax=Nonomuraea sp. NPDC050643 TaxID=3155660 RepID=UPI0033D7FB00
MLWGRSAETGTIDALLRGARQRRSSVLVLRGEAGIGKTSLLEYARNTAGGLRTAMVRGSEPELRLAFAGLAQVVTPAQNLLATLPGVQARALRGAVALGPPDPTDRFAVYAATLGLLAQLAEDTPLLLTLDDAHVLDGPSVEAFAFTARRLVAEGIVILVATRAGQPDRGPWGDLPSLTVMGLDEESVAELIAKESGVHPARPVVKELTRSTLGNPMALREIVEKLSAAQLAGRRPLPESCAAESTASVLFARRVAELSDPALTALFLLAISPSGGLAEVLEAAEILQVPEPAFEEIEVAGFAVLADSGFQLAHPLVAAAAVAAVPPSRRRSVHRVLAAVLTEPSQADERAWHLAEATLGTDEKVAAALEQMAATARSRSGYTAAATALERAAALSTTDTTRAHRLYAAASDAHMAGQSSRARELLVAADNLAADDERLRVALAAGRSRVETFTGHPRLARQILQETAERNPHLDAVTRAELLTDAAMAALLSGEPEHALATAAEAATLAPEPVGKVALVTMLVRGITLLHLGDYVAGARLIRQCVEIATLPEESRPAVEYVILSAGALNWVEEPAAALETVTPVLTGLRAAGALGLLPFALYVASMAETQTGRISAGHAAATEAVDLAVLTGDELWQYLARSALAFVEAVRGNAESCRTQAARAIDLCEGTKDYPRDAAEALALLELGLGRYEEAIGHLLDGARRTPVSDQEALVESHPYFLEARIRSGRGLTRRMAVLVEDMAAEVQFPLRAAVASRLRGLDSEHDAFEHFETALDLHKRAMCPFELARTLLAYGERLRRARRRIQARQRLRAALEIFQRLDAQPWADRARREITATGESVRDRAAVSVLHELTPQEHQVARAVVRGATNREAATQLFLSAKTVEFHLGSVYRKLGVRTRTELAHRHPELADG